LIPLFHGEKQQKTSVQALRRRESKLQVIDFLWIRREFRYADEQRKFFSLSAELKGRTAELQRNLSGARD
jgi:hypothetical protein